MVHYSNSFRSMSGIEKRSAGLRRSVSIEATIKQVDTAEFRSLLRDLSPEGFQLFCASSLRADRTLMIKIAHLAKLPAEIRWAEGNSYGCRFKTPLYPAVFDHILRLAGAA